MIRDCGGIGSFPIVNRGPYTTSKIVAFCVIPEFDRCTVIGSEISLGEIDIGPVGRKRSDLLIKE